MNIHTLALPATLLTLAGIALALQTPQPTTQTQPSATGPTTAATATAPTPSTRTSAPTTTAPTIRERPPAAALQTTGTLTGRLLDATGKPVAGAIIAYSSRQPPAINQLPVPEAISAPDGTFTLHNFPSGPRHATLTFFLLGAVIGTAEIDSNLAPGTTLRLDADIRVAGPIATPVRTGQ